MILTVVIFLLGFSSVQCDPSSYTPPKLNEEPVDTFGVEGEPLQLKCQATGNPTPTYTWEKDLKEISTSTPGYTIQNGYLNIAKFNPAIDVGKYQCIVRSNVISVQKAELKLVSRVVTVSAATVPSVFKNDIQPVTAYSGGAMRLSVDASNFVPSPKIAWNYRGKPSISSNDPRFTVLPNGVLQAHSLTSADNGLIRAVALAASVGGTKTNDLVYGKFQDVTVQSASDRPSTRSFYFLAKPQDVNVKWGRPIILEVHADSGSDVSYAWYKDGKVLQLGNRKSIIGQGNLRILYAKEEDSGSYKVIVKSGGKSIEAAAKVTVMSAPQFTIVPPPRVTGYEEESVTFNFKVIGNPKPKVQWYRDGQQIISTDNYADPQDDKLILNNIITFDGGMYQARATNAMGDAEMSLELVVLPLGSSTPTPTVAPKIPSPPQNLQMTGQSDSSISLSWKLPSSTHGTIQNYRIEYKDIQGGNLQSSVTTNLKYSVTGLQSSTTYELRVQAINSNGAKGDFTSFVTVKTRDAPLPPKGVIDITHTVSGTDLKLSWKPDPSGPTPTNYKIDLTNVDTGKQETIFSNIPSKTLLGLNAGASYSYSITPILNQLEGAASTLVTVTIPAAIIKPTAPQNLQITGQTDTTVSLSWKLPSSTTNGGIQNYRVEYQDSKGGSSGTPMTSKLSYKITGLQPSTTYKIRVQAIDKQGKVGDYTSYKTVTTAATPGVIDSLLPRGKTSTTISLEWKPPAGGQLPTSYQVYVKNLDDQTVTQSVTNQPSYSLTNLQPYTNYQMYVVPVFASGPGKESIKLDVKTFGQVPAPTGLSVVLINTTSAKVSWDPVPRNKIQGVLDSYKLEYYQKGANTNTIQTIPKIMGGTTIIIKNLRQDTNYKFNVKAVLKDGQESAPSNTEKFKTNVATSQNPDPATKFSMVQNPDEPDYITMLWTEPRYITGVLKNYLLYFKAEGDSSYKSFPLPGTYSSYRISDFKPGTKYFGYIVPVDTNGAGMKSNEFQLTTLSESKAPLAPVKLVINPKSDSLVASWQPAPSSIVVRSYLVEIFTKGGNSISSNTLNGKSNTEIRVYNDIEPDTEYVVTVKAVNNAGSSPIATKSSSTLIAYSPSILIQQVDAKPEEMFIKWKDIPVKTTPTSYSIKYDDVASDGSTVQKIVTSDKPTATIKGLTPFTRYKFFIKRDGDPSYPVSANVDAKTAGAVPSAPLSVGYFMMDGYKTWALVDWKIPENPNGIIQSYTVLYTTNTNLIDTTKMDSVVTQGAVLSRNMTDLNPDVNYQFIVFATNSAGDGVRSTPLIMDLGPTGGFLQTQSDGGFEWWWWLILLLLLLLLLLLFLLCIYCCCCGWCMRCCFGCCPCCKGCWYCCCLPFLACCCPCCCGKDKEEDEKLYITSPVVAVGPKANGNSGIGLGAWKGGANGKAGDVELMPLTGNPDGSYAPSSQSGLSGLGTLSRRTSKSSDAAIKVPIPGDVTFISYKTSLQDYCQKVGWLPPIYSTTQFDDGFHSKVSFGGSTFESGAEFGASRQDAEQRAAHMALLGLGCIGDDVKYSSEVSIAVPTAGDASFISYKCSLHDFCQQCNILPPRFITNSHDNGFSSSVQVGSHTFNMSSRAQNSAEAEQKVACIALQGLCMMDSQSGYYPEACFHVPGPVDKSFISFKSSLHDFCQKYKLPPPQYITNQGSHGYSAKLKFGGLFFHSSNHFVSRIEAEQHAAFEALQGLGLLESSVEFDSVHTSGGVHVGAGGAANASVVVGGMNSSRNTSKGNSRTNSRPPSRPGSRQGSTSQLNVSGQYNTNTSMDQRDTAYNSIDSRTFNVTSSTGYDGHNSGYDGHNSLTRNDGHNSLTRNDVHNSLTRNEHYNSENNATSYQGGYAARNGSVNGNQSSTYSGPVSGTGNGNVSVVIKTSSTGNQPVIGHEQDGEVYAFSYSNYTGSETVPRSRSKSVEQNYDSLDGGHDGNQHMMQYEQNSRSSSGYATMPKKQITTNSSGSSHVQYSSSSYNTSSTSRSYSSSQNVTKSHGYNGGAVRGAASQPVLPDLEKEMAGLEGLIKDLNGITTSGKIA